MNKKDLYILHLAFYRWGLMSYNAPPFLVRCDHEAIAEQLEAIYRELA